MQEAENSTRFGVVNEDQMCALTRSSAPIPDKMQGCFVLVHQYGAVRHSKATKLSLRVRRAGIERVFDGYHSVFIGKK
jgi:hypothetical protein